MKLKVSIILVCLLIFTASLFAGCININDRNDKEKKEQIVTVSDKLILNETKMILIEDTSYNFTVKKIDDEIIILDINSRESLLLVKIGILLEVDTDHDGTNELEINVTDVTDTIVSITLKTTTTTSEFRYISDNTEVTVKVPKKIEKIISLAPSITEILFSLELGKNIIGRDSASNYPSQANKIDIVSTYEGIDIEKILVKDPDLIIMDKTLDFYDTNYNKMIEYGLCVFRVYPNSLQDVLDNLQLLGKVTNTESTAKQIIADLESRIEIVETRESTQPSVLYVIYYDGSSSPWVGTSSTFSGDLIRIAGGKPVVDDDSGISIQITIERLVDLNPDIIFTSQDQTWPTPSREAILNDETLQELNAVKNDMVIDVNADLIDRPGPRLVDGLELLSNYIVS